MLDGQLDERPPLIHRQGQPGRVVERRQDVQELRSRFRAGQAVGGARGRAHPRHDRPSARQLRPRKVSGASGRRSAPPRRPVARAAEERDEEVEADQRPGRDEDPFRRDAVAAAEPLTQRAVTRRRPVVQRDPTVDVDCPTGALGELGEREHVGRRARLARTRSRLYSGRTLMTRDGSLATGRQAGSRTRLRRPSRALGPDLEDLFRRGDVETVAHQQKRGLVLRSVVACHAVLG